MTNARSRLNALAQELYDAGLDPSITEARRHVHRLDPSDLEYAAAKSLQETINDIRREERREAERAAGNRRADEIKRQNRDRREREASAREESIRESARRAGEAHDEWQRTDGAERERIQTKIKELSPGDEYPGVDVDVAELKRIDGPEISWFLLDALRRLEELGLRPRLWTEKRPEDWSDEDFDVWRGAYRDRDHPHHPDSLRLGLAATMEVRKREIARDVHEAAEDAAAQKFLKWTEDLLGAKFRLADGTLTTWGAATIEQHRERAEMFERNATASVVGAGRHLQAVQELEAARAATLNDLVKPPVSV